MENTYNIQLTKEPGLCVQKATVSTNRVDKDMCSHFVVFSPLEKGDFLSCKTAEYVMVDGL